MSTTIIGSEIANLQRSKSAVDIMGSATCLPAPPGMSLPPLPFIVMLASDTNGKPKTDSFLLVLVLI